MTVREIREIVLGATPLAVREWGPADGVPFLFWHSVGPGGSGATLEVAAGPLADAGFSVFAPDAPGFGLSATLLGQEEYALERLAGLFWDVADSLALQRPILSGHSWGGAVAVAAAGLRPRQTRALVLFDSGHVDYADWPGADLTAAREQLVAAARADSELESWDALVSLLADEHLDQEWTLAAWREAVRETPDGGIALRVEPTARGAALYELTRARPSDSWQAIGEAEIPTLLFLATEPAEVGEANDRLVDRFEREVPQADVVRLAGCRHQVFADLGPMAGTLVVEWLAKLGLP